MPSLPYLLPVRARLLSYSSALLLTATIFLSACGQLNRQTNEQTHAATEAIKAPLSIYPVVLQEATELQGTMVDGWYHAEDSRSLKTGYAAAPADLKAKFACEYQAMLSANNQDMVNNWKSYVPWTKRAAFARRFWSDPENSTTFLKQDRWKQIQWMHESLRDGSELWWRAYEKKFPEGIDSAASMAHEAEQDMVTNFKEDESSPPRSFSAWTRTRFKTTEYGNNTNEVQQYFAEHRLENSAEPVHTVFFINRSGTQLVITSQFKEFSMSSTIKKISLSLSLFLLAGTVCLTESGCSKEQELKNREQKLADFSTSVANHLLDRNPETIKESLTILMHQELNDTSRQKLSDTKVIPDTPITLLRETDQWKTEHRSNKLQITVKPVTPIDKPQVTYHVSGTDSVMIDGKKTEDKPIDFSIVCLLTPDMDGFPRVADVIGLDKKSKESVGSTSGSSGSSSGRRRRRH